MHARMHALRCIALVNDPITVSKLLPYDVLTKPQRINL